MVRVKKEVAIERSKIALNMAKNLEAMAECDPDEYRREAALIIINQLKRTANGGKNRSIFTDAA